MKQIKIITFLFIAMLITSCATPQSRTTGPSEYWGIIPLSFQQVVSTPAAYSTEKGRKLMVRYEKNLEDIFRKIRMTYNLSEIEFVPYIRNKSAGLSFMKRNDSNSDERFLALAVIAPFAFFEKGQSTYQERAAVIFTKYVRDMMEIALQEMRIMNDTDIAGVWISISWSTMDAKSVKRGEGFSLIATKENATNFINHLLTAQAFADKSTIWGIQEGRDLGAVFLAVGSTMKSVDTLNKKGFALSSFETGTELIAEGKLQTAISFLDRAIELDPSYSEAYYFRGSAYASLNNHDAAIENLANALKTAKEGAFKDFVTAGLAALNNNPADSCNHLKRAINTKSNNSAAISSLNMPYIIKNDAIFDSIRKAACYKEIIIEK
jgi:tetratricopeptide (TPR) repeat protein